MASGHVNRTQRPNTWLHRPTLRRDNSPCQLGAVHTWPIAAVAAVQLYVRSRVNTGSDWTALETTLMTPNGPELLKIAALRPTLLTHFADRSFILL